jgi:hypothetical protein
MKVLSLGWGVQSFTLAAMSALGEVESLDVAIHADTTHERRATYEFAAQYAPWLEAHGLRVVTVVNTASEIGQSFLRDGRAIVDIPAYTISPRGDGQIRRQCTHDWKIAHIRRWLQANRSGGFVEQWIGISLDEIQRAKPSDVKYIIHCWPLLERRMTRQDCIAWLRRRDLDVPPKSSCVFCPYHNRHAWYDMKTENGDDWRKAIAVDEAIRKSRPPHDLFVHSDRVPLVDIRSPQDDGQLELPLDICDSGYCFL